MFWTVVTQLWLQWETTKSVSEYLKSMLEKMWNKEWNDVDQKQMEANKIKEGQDNEEEEQGKEEQTDMRIEEKQDNLLMKAKISFTKRPLEKGNNVLKFVNAIVEQEGQFLVLVWAPGNLMGEFRMEQNKRDQLERSTKTKLDEILENWFKTEGKFTVAVDFLKNYQPFPRQEIHWIVYQDAKPNQNGPLVTSNKRNEMPRATEENEIKEGQEKVEEEQGNEKRESTFSSPRKFCRNLLNEERGQVEGNKIEEGQKEVQEEQDNEFRKGRNKRDQLKSVKESTYKRDILELGNLGKRHFDEPFWIKRNGRAYVDGLLENWFRTERRRDVVVQEDAQNERQKLIDNLAEFSVELDDAENEILELEQLLRCKVCLDSDACIVFFPCRHMATCENCEGFLHCCPVCRSFIEEAVKINEE